MTKSRKSKRTKSKRPRIAAIDLFCGAGGLTRGLLKQSIVVKAGFDIDPFCKYAFEHNNDSRFILKDVSKLKRKEIKKFLSSGDVTVIAGCAPCQPFSKYTQGRDSSKDEKWSMLYEFARIVEETLPDVVTMENVPQLKRHKVYNDFENKLTELGYDVTSSVVFCPDYGIPQTRHRLVLLASRLGPINLVKVSHKAEEYKTVRQTIGNLPSIKAGGSDRKDPLHTTSTLSDKNLLRIKASKPGGSWLEWDRNLVADCHKKSGRATYRSVYGRMSWNKPSPTITTQFIGFGNGRFGHPKQNRAISLREGAMLQTFPKKYRFVEPGKPIHFKHVARLIGNAVPVKLGEIIGKSIRKHVDTHYES